MPSTGRVLIDAELVRRRTAEEMTRSSREIPAFHLCREVVAENLGATAPGILADSLEAPSC